MKKIFYDTIKNADGSPAEVVLNEKESKIAAYWQTVANALGYDIAITTLTTIAKKITEQKFYIVAPADYVPVKVGDAAWSDQIVAYRDFSMGDTFETGIINLADDDSRLASATAGVDSIPVPVFNWAKQNTWSLPQLEQAAKSGNWDVVASKERSRKRNWDLGIQRIAFLGAKGQNTAGLAANKQVLGLLNQDLSATYGSQVTVDTATITQLISTMSATQLSTLLQTILSVYQANNGYTAMPTHFVIPTDDYLGLGAQTSPSFPIKSILEVMEDTLKAMTGNASFKVLPSAYGIPANNSLGKHLYALYNYEEESIRMDIPVDYTNTLANTVNNFQFQSVAYGQFTGVGLYRPLEMYYFRF